MNKYRQLFPIFKTNPGLVYLDSAATTQKPQEVIDRITRFYQSEYANIHRGLYNLSEEATKNYEEARQTVADFVGRKAEEVIFTRNTTESLNLIALSWGEKNIKRGEEILISEMEHHSNLVPWQLLAKKKQAKLKYIPINKTTGRLNLENIDKLINKKTKILSLTVASNVLGTINREIPILIRRFKKVQKEGIAIGDLAQSIAHLPTAFDFDFIAFSGHKIYGPDGIGILAGRKALLDALSPIIVGGGNIESVSQDQTIFQVTPYKFEAGTPNIAGALGLTEAIKFIQKIGINKIEQHEQNLTKYALDRLSAIGSLTILGSKNFKDRIGVISFTIDGIHPHDVAQLLADEGVAIRAGHHCAQPLHSILGLTASCRISFGIYNEEEDMDKLVTGLRKVIKIFKNSKQTRN